MFTRLSTSLAFQKTYQALLKTQIRVSQRGQRGFYFPQTQGFSGALETFLKENLKKQALLGIYGYLSIFGHFWVTIWV